MGRTLDYLRQAEGHRAALPSLPPPSLAAECVTDWTLAEHDAPYIEVGGPNKLVELSPQLTMKHPAQPATRPPHTTPAAPVRTLVASLAEPRPLSVAFEPWSGAAPPRGVAPEIIAFHQPDHAAARSYAALCDKLLADLPAGCKLLLLCGTRPDTSTVLLNLAVVAAKAGRRVLALDAHADACLAPRLGVTPAGTMLDVLAGRLALDQALTKTAVPSLHVLHAPLDKTALTSEALAWLASWLRTRHDVVLIEGDDVALLAPLCDATFAVLARGESAGALADVPRLRGLIHTHVE